MPDKKSTTTTVSTVPDSVCRRTKRDPRVDPLPGDTLKGPTKQSAVRLVTGITSLGDVAFCRPVHAFNQHSEHTGIIRLHRWRTWARKGVVIYQSQ